MPRLPLAESFLRGDDPGHEFIEPEETLALADAPEEEAFDLWGEVRGAPNPEPAGPPTPDLGPLLERLERVLARLEAAADHGFVGALERLLALYDAGGLSDDEFQVAKERLLRG